MEGIGKGGGSRMKLVVPGGRLTKDSVSPISIHHNTLKNLISDELRTYDFYRYNLVIKYACYSQKITDDYKNAVHL